MSARDDLIDDFIAFSTGTRAGSHSRPPRPNGCTHSPRLTRTDLREMLVELLRDECVPVGSGHLLEPCSGR
jgi:hypothetical protein